MPGKKSQKKRLEEWGDELREILKDKLKQTDGKEWIETGFYLSAGYLAFISMGKVEKTDDSDRGMEYVKAQYRESLRDAMKELRDSLAWKLPLVNWKPVGHMADMVAPFYKLLDNSRSIDGIEYWDAVPVEMRIIMAISIPSLLYMSVEMVKGMVEIAGIT